MKQKLVVMIATVLMLTLTVSAVSAEDSLSSTIDSISTDEGTALTTSDTTSLHQEAVNADEYKSSTTSGETLKSGKVPAALLKDIDDQVDSLYREEEDTVKKWDISKDQFKIMLAVLAYGEGNPDGKCRYAAHSSDKADVWHKDLPKYFHFSSGLGPFQITATNDWTTIDKLNSKKALKDTISRHKTYSGDGFKNLGDVRSKLKGQWFAYRLSSEGNGKFEKKWEEATGTVWNDAIINTNKETKNSPLNWMEIKKELSYTEEVEDKAIEPIGMRKWTISKGDGVENYNKDTIELNKDLHTWLIHAKKLPEGDKATSYEYYYTYDKDQKIEIWAYSNAGDTKHDKKSIFVRTYDKPGGWNVQRRPDNDGFTLNHPVFTDSSTSTSDVPISDGFDFPVGWPNGDGYRHGTKNDKNGYDFLEYSTYSESLHPGEDWNGVDDKGNSVGNADFGDSVYAISNGRVVAAKSIGGNLGNVIVIEHRLQDGSTVWSQYAHLNEMLVKEGDNVKRGKEIGTIGKSRDISHLHFEIRKSDLSPSAWPKGQSEEEIRENYFGPSKFINSHRPQIEDEAEGNANVVLVIDRSGSMYGTPISNAKNSAKQFIDQMESEDKAGVVSFSSSASRDYSLTTLTDNERDFIKKKINSISASGTTAIGSGLEFALNDLEDNGDKNSHQAIVLLSDGQHNTGKHPDKVIPSIKASNIQVYTIGLGYYFNERLLKDIAKETDGMYFYTPTESQLNQIYNKIAGKVLALDTASELTISMATNDVMSVDVDVDTSMEKVSFSTSWPGSNVDLVLYKPDGSIVDPSVADSDPTIEYLLGPTYKIYKVTDPEPGKWTMELTATDMPAGGEDVYVAVRAESTLSMLLSTDKDQYNQGEIVKVTAGLSDAGTQITGADVKVNVTLPDSSVEQLILYDDGGHGDSEAQDGVYANYFVDTSLMGDYKVDAASTGSLPDGSQFTRINDTSFEIIQGTSSILLSPENLSIEGKAGGQITENVTVSTSQTSTSVTITPTLLKSENGDVIDTGSIEVDPTTVNVSAGVPENVLITIDVPESAASGNYTGKIIATGVGGSASCTVDLRVTKDAVIGDFVSPVINSVDLYPANSNPGSVIAVTVNATDDVGVTSVKANDISFHNQGGNLWKGDITALEGTHSVNVSAVDEAGNIAWDNSTSYTALKPGNLPPSSINLQSTKGITWINWIWTNPTDPDFSYYEIYLDGVFQTNISAEYFNATGLEPDTGYTIGMHDVDINGNINQTWVNQTVTTEKEFELGIEFPVANFTTNVSEGHAPLSVQFNDSSENAVSFNWDFGDGKSSIEKNPIHTYLTAGIYTVNLTVSNENGTDSKLAKINVSEKEVKEVCDDTKKDCKPVCDDTKKDCKPVCDDTKKDCKSPCKDTKPACKETKPDCKETKPTCKETEPTCKETKPDCKETEPTCKETKPDCKETKPICKETKPTCKETKPDCKETKPICKETKPDCKETKKLSEETKESSENTDKVSEETKPAFKEAESTESENTEKVSEDTKEVSEEAKEAEKTSENTESENTEKVNEGTKEVSENTDKVSEETKEVSEEAKEAEKTSENTESENTESENTDKVNEDTKEVSEDTKEVSEDTKEVSEDTKEVSEEAKKAEKTSEEAKEVNSNNEKV